MASQCRRVAHRRFRSKTGSIWTSEPPIIAVLEYFCMASRVAARHGSSVPGPMENRRRLGKRHMGELNFGQPNSALPLWALESLADLTKWQWKPPSTPDARLREHRTENAQERSLAGVILNWLTGHSPKSLSTVDISKDDTSTPIPEFVHQLLPKITWDAQTTPSEVVNAGLDLFFQDLASDTTIEERPNFETFCDIWRHHLANGLFTGESICSVLGGIQSGLDASQTSSEQPLERVVDRCKFSLLDMTITGLCSRQSHENNHSERLVWSQILQNISELRMNSIRLFNKAIQHVPEDYLSYISESELANLRTYLMASSRSNGRRSSMIRQTNKMVEPLKRLNLASHPDILENFTQYVLTRKEAKDTDYSRMRFGWLQLLARLPGIDDRYLARTCCILEAGRDTVPLSNREICEMYLSIHRSSIKNIEKIRNGIQESRAQNDYQCYGFLSMALWYTGQFGHVKGLCGFLGMLGREQDIMRLAKGARNLVKNEATPLVSVAIGMGMPMLAIDIYDLYENVRADRSGYWGGRSSTESLRSLTRSRSLRHSRVLKALRLGISVAGRKHHTALELSKAAEAAMAFAISPNLSPRSSLELISECIRHLEKSQKVVIPKAVLRALLHNITRDLAEGRLGRTSRLRWFLYLLHKYAGYNKMVQIGLALKKWRSINAYRHRRRMRSGYYLLRTG